MGSSILATPKTDLRRAAGKAAHTLVTDNRGALDREELPKLLARLGQIDLFHHDSLHTYEHMMWEYETAFSHLAPNGVLSSHDVRTMTSLTNPFQRNPFATFCKRHNLYAVESRNVGIAVRSAQKVCEPSGEGGRRFKRPIIQNWKVKTSR